MIEDSFVNHTRKKTAGMTIHGVISSRLIANGDRSKDELKQTVEYFDQEIIDRTKEMEKILGLSPKHKPGIKD